MSKLYTEKLLVMSATNSDTQIIVDLKDSILQNISKVVSDADPGKRQVCHETLKQIGDALGITSYTSPVPIGQR